MFKFVVQEQHRMFIVALGLARAVTAKFAAVRHTSETTRRRQTAELKLHVVNIDQNNSSMQRYTSRAPTGISIDSSRRGAQPWALLALPWRFSFSFSFRGCYPARASSIEASACAPPYCCCCRRLDVRSRTACLAAAHMPYIMLQHDKRLILRSSLPKRRQPPLQCPHPYWYCNMTGPPP